MFSDLVNQILRLSNSRDNIDEDFEIALKILKSLKINDDLIKEFYLLVYQFFLKELDLIKNFFKAE